MNIINNNQNIYDNINSITEQNKLMKEKILLIKKMKIL